MLILLLAPQGSGAQTVFDLRDVLGELYRQLGASGSADLEFWTEDELYRYFDDASKRLARNTGCFVVRDVAISTAIGTAEYTNSSRHLSTLHVSYLTDSLNQGTVEEIEALDPDWQAAANAAPARAVQYTGLATLRLYPPPDAVKLLPVVQHEFPLAVSASSTGVAAPVALRDYWRFWAQGEARGKESKGAMPEVAQWMHRLTDLYEDVARSYWGNAE